MEIINICGPGTASWPLSINADATCNDQKHSDHALAQVISDMVFLSQKIDSFCSEFELARGGQCQRETSPQKTPGTTTMAKT